MRVKRESPLPTGENLAYKWDDAARKYFDHFELELMTARRSLWNNLRSPFLKESLLNQTFKKIDLLRYRQILGDISKEEIREANHVTGDYFFTKSRAEPAKIFAWNKMLAAVWGISAGAAFYGKFIKGYSIIWLAVPFAPVWTFLFYNACRQPKQELENAYRYTMAKRSATCEFEAGKAEMQAHLARYGNEAKTVKTYLEESGKTLYSLEADVYDALLNGTLK